MCIYWQFQIFSKVDFVMRKLEELRYITEHVDDRKENWFEERAQNQEEEILVIVGVLM